MTTRPNLDTLPSDVLVQIYTHLDSISLAQLLIVNSAFNSPWKEYPEHISRSIAIRQGWTKVQTAGAAAPLAVEDQGHVATKEGGESEVLRLAKDQWSTTEIYDQVKNWSSFARIRAQVDRNWNKPRYSSQFANFDLSRARSAHFNGDEFWRFKVDPINGWTLVTGYRGGVWAFDKNQLVWRSRIPAEQQPHIELTYNSTTSYLVTSLDMFRQIVWRYEDPTQPTQGDPLPELSVEEEAVLQAIAPFATSFNREGRGYRPHCLFTFPFVVSATKLRFPYLLASCAAGQQISLRRFDAQGLRDNVSYQFDSMRSVEEADEGGIRYIDFDDLGIFVAGKKSIRYYKHYRCQPAPEFEGTPEWKTWPPSSPEGYRFMQPLIPPPLYRDQARFWDAVHHDSRSNHLVAVAGTGITMIREAEVMWTCGYREAIWSEDREEIEQRTMILVAEGAKISQLSVENDRLLFTAHTASLGHSLFYIPLRNFTSLSDFASNPPRPICLQYPLQFISPPSRLEQTSTDVYYPVQTLDTQEHRPVEMAYREALEIWEGIKEDSQVEYPFHLRWKTLDGQSLVDYEKESLKKGDVDLERMQVAWTMVKSRSDIGAHEGFQDIMRLSFADVR